MLQCAKHSSHATTQREILVKSQPLLHLYKGEFVELNWCSIRVAIRLTIPVLVLFAAPVQVEYLPGTV